MSAVKCPALADFRRIVVKVGSSLLVDSSAGKLKEAWLASLAQDIAGLHGEKRDVLVVSSGAIALGRAVLKLPKGPLKLEDSQAAAAVGQIALARTWAEALGQHSITAGQVLVTLTDTEERRRYLNARNTIAKLLEWRSVPVINENDTVATNEIRYGDNDRLAARVAAMASADLLVLLSDVDGLYNAPPASSANPKHIPLVPRITAEIEAMAGASGSELSRGGMVTKIEAGKIVTTAGAHMVIASGHVEHPLKAIAAGARDLVPHAGQPCHRAQEVDRRIARAQRHADHRRGGRCCAASREKPAPRRGGPCRRRVRPRRCRAHPRPRRRRNRPRSGRLRRRRRGKDRAKIVERHHADSGRRRPR
jgi:glutamate 5-kinase